MAVIAPQQNLDRLHWLFVATLLLFAVFTCLFGLSLYTEWRLDRAHERRYQSYLLADELRQSSDDLTRMARSYIASSNPKYLAYYDEILAIRDGRIARPLHYNRIYWDLVFPRQQRPQQRGEPASLLGLMQRGGFSALELARLTEAKQQSDRLTLREREAMAMLARADSLPSREAAALREAARLMLNDEAYFLAKARIMRPIDEVYGLIEQRTAFEVTQAAQQAALVRLAFMLVALGLCLLLLRMRRYSREVLGCNLRQLYGYIVQLGREPPPRIPARSGSDDTVLAWLVRTDARLRQLAAAQARVQQQLVRQALTDTLTGLGNRRALQQQLADWLALPPPAAWGLAYLDLDGFKPVNDQHGHAVGDALLQAVAQTLDRLSPPPLCVARVGGDEFVLLLEGGGCGVADRHAAPGGRHCPAGRSGRVPLAGIGQPGFAHLRGRPGAWGGCGIAAGGWPDVPRQAARQEPGMLAAMAAGFVVFLLETYIKITGLLGLCPFSDDDCRARCLF